VAQLKFGSAGVSAREIDLSGQVAQLPVGIPAGIIGTALQGPAFVPVTVGNNGDFYAKFGLTDGKKAGPLGAIEWLRSAKALTYVRVLGVGDGKRRNENGSVTTAGFTVGEEQPRSSDGALAPNTYANTNGEPGRLYFLGAFMSESAGSTVFSDAGLQGPGSVTPGVTTAVPIVRGVLMAPSGVILRLSSSVQASVQPASTLIASDATAQGSHNGTIRLLDNNVAKQEFVLLLNGHKGTNSLYPNVITASFDMTAPNYFANVLNSDPLRCQEAGHLLYANWDIHPTNAVVTGTGIVTTTKGAGGSAAVVAGAEAAVFITTSSLARNVGSDSVPNFESWSDRFSHAQTPWVISQKFGGNAANLFKLHALDAGSDISTNYKISIENIAPSTDPANQYGSFDVVLRDWADNDMNVTPLEQWRGINLDPDSDRYIAKVIGDQHIFFNFDQSDASQKLIVDGNYQNASNLVRVEVSSDVDNKTVDATALPFGFRGIQHLMTSGSMPLTSPATTEHTVASALKRVVEMPLPLREDITQGSGTKISVNPLLYWGAKFEHATNLATQNASTLKNASLESFAKFFPSFSLTEQNVVVGDNSGETDTVANGIIDADRFCRNMFTLENIQVVTGSTGLADPAQWASAVYVRNGNITANDTAKTRKLDASDFIQANRRFLKYSFFMQGGFNGVNVFDSDESQLNDAAVTADMNDADRGRQNGPNVKAYIKALDIMKNTTDVDIQVLAIPGIRQPVVTDYAISSVEDRFDALYVMDPEQFDNTGAAIVSDSQMPSVTLTVDAFRNRSLDSNFAAAYFPDQVITDPNTKTNVMAPPSVAVLGAIAYNDKIGHPWFAPAGFARGALQTSLEARVKLSKQNMDDLYDVSLNPLVAFPGNATAGTNPKGGVVVWGQKTLQRAASALDRVNVRRLLIDIRRQVRDIATTITFEPAREATLAKFSAAVTPRLQRIQALSGVEKYKVIIDSSSTTQADIENNTLRGKIFLKPTKSIEFVSLDFVVQNNITEV
jgi:phage tail sheath protein FI